MLRCVGLSFALLACLASSAWAVEISGDYIESRTCDIYTGPCFANSESTLTGKTAVMAWKIDQGKHQGVDLKGLKVVMAIKASNTLALGGGMKIDPGAAKAVILVDAKATTEQRAALEAFAREKAGRYGKDVARVDAVPIEMNVDHVDMAAQLSAGREVKLATRKLAKIDQCCTNEVIYYPPLAQVENYEAAYVLDAGFMGRGLGVRWENPGTRSAFLATFAH
jgi:hypothetical protein